MLKRLSIIIIIALTINIMTSCTDTKYKKITAQQAKEMMTNEEAIIVDVRELHEFNAGHIEGAILLPLSNLEALAEEMLTDKNAIILIYCRSGNRSKTAALELIDLGYKNVYDFGGILDWTYGTVV